jgi:hypothetical protein
MIQGLAERRAAAPAPDVAPKVTAEHAAASGDEQIAARH